MARSETGELVRPSAPGKVRRFPWRLWLFALVMAGAAGAGGYFTWHYRGAAEAAAADGAKCSGALATTQGELGTARQTADACRGERDAAVTRGTELTRELEPLRENLDASKEELATLRAGRAEAEKRLAAITEIQQQFAKMIDTGSLEVKSRRGSLVLSLPAEVLFPSGVAELSEDGKLKVLEVGLTLKKFPDRRFLVIGHSDAAPLKASVYKDNWELSTARALTVTRFLVQAGMNPQNLIPAGAGAHDPLARGTSAKDLARNRRIEIALLPAINELPPLPPSIDAKDDAKDDARDDAPAKGAPRAAPKRPD